MSGYLFLDIDGVLNDCRKSEDTYSPKAHWTKRQHTWAAGLHRDKVERINQLWKVLGQPTVVLTSSWRSRPWGPMCETLHEKGAEFNLWYRTPVESVRRWDDSKLYMLSTKDLPKEVRRTQIRGMQIEQWLLTHVPFETLPTTPILIVDDATDMGRLRPWLLRTQSWMGISDQDVTLGPNLFKPLGRILIHPHPDWATSSVEELYGQDYQPDFPSREEAHSSGS